MRTPEQLEPIRKMARDDILRAQLWAVKNGVPFDVAFALDGVQIQAWSIIFTEFESGKRYDFERDCWPPDGAGQALGQQDDDDADG